MHQSTKLGSLFYVMTLSFCLAMFAENARAQSGDKKGETQNAAEAKADNDTDSEPKADTESEAKEDDGPKETICNDRKDNDKDGISDCGDADCFDSPDCAPGGDEVTEEACSDWIDNDNDDSIDCEDEGCAATWYCRGSLRDNRENHNQTSNNQTSSNVGAPERQDPKLARGQEVEDLVGVDGDAIGENNDFVCSDGFDNDGDGRVDCADYGCRYDPAVSVCDDKHDYHFSVVAGISTNMTVQGNQFASDDPVFDARFSRLQVRALGEIPLINNSFFLLSMRLEKTPRLTFANFQLPVGNMGHYIAVNSGSANLSTNIVLSVAKQPLLDAPFYLTNAFEEGNGAAVEFGGPIDAANLFNFRIFGAAGSGEFNGNVGGRFFRSDDRNFSWGAGLQVGANLIGAYNRFDSRFLYTKRPLSLAVMLGGKYDQRPADRYPSGHALVNFGWSHVLLHTEFYYKYSIETESSQIAWNVAASGLIIPKLLVISADIGSYYGEKFRVVPANAPDNPLDELQWRVAASMYWWRDKGLVTARLR